MSTRITKEQLLPVMGDDAPAKELTASKTAYVMARDESEITGFVVTDGFGNVGIIDKSACIWMAPEQMWKLMHGE